MTFLPRLLGALTAAYGAGLLVSPKQLLAQPCDLTEGDGSVSAPVATLSRAIGARDVISGLLMCAAPRGNALRAAIAVRAASDLADAAVLGVSLPNAQARAKAAAVAGSWGGLCALSARGAGGCRRGRK